ncbi:hypothetical protein F5884DRAFT_684069 [Xylogone sp. PMI_703]|nr:hypothetical protein F5884DRAFT_684069 [Xylogone sp. PMI_703]
MFYDGDLQSGINKALQESKLVACFVTDGNDESLLWEQDFLNDASLMDALSQQTILLRLVANSQEAAYLAAIFPLPKVPTFVIIQNGELKEYITSGTSKAEFLSRVGNVLHIAGPGGNASPASPRSSGNTSHIAPPQADLHIQTSQPDTSQSVISSEAHQSSSAVPPAHGQAQEQDLEDGYNWEEEAQDQNSYALSQKKRLKEDKDERLRILKQVENDKIERRKREAQRKVEESLRNPENSHGAVSRREATNGPQPHSQTRSQQCAIQARLFDGQTIRSRFPATGSLRADVRPWIDAQQQEIGSAYTFKQVLTPMPNKNISISEEEQSLESLGLCPNATLILVPIERFTTAFGSGSMGGVVTGTLSTGYSLVSSTVNAVTGLLGGLFGGNTASSTSNSGQVLESQPRITSQINVRTLRDRENSPGSQQFYNGNTLNFEPRRSSQESERD